MARSDYVYVVTRPLSNGVIAAFTVRHELATWLYRRYDRNVTVTRVQDGPAGGDASKISDMDVAELTYQGYLQAAARWERTVPQYRGERPLPPA